MAALTLTSPDDRPLRPLVEGAIQNELRLLEAGIRRTEANVEAFEAKYGLSTAEFVRRYERDKLPESLEYAEYRLLQRLREKAETLRGIRFAY